MSGTLTNNKRAISARSGRGSVLIVDNDPHAARLLLEILAKKGILAHLAQDKPTAMQMLEKEDCLLAFVNEHITEGAARSWFNPAAEIRRSFPELPVVMMADPDTFAEPSSTRPNGLDSLRMGTRKAVEAVRQGCCDYLVKPLRDREAEALIETYMPNHEVSRVAWARDGSRYLYEIVGRSVKMVQSVELAGRIAATSAPVLITGESGTGKELLSYLIHHKSRRAQGPFVRVNCAALNDSLLESELFGHEKGAFTGAYTRRKGRFEMAHGGTLLLDEITETPLNFQAKLLRILEQQEFERVGGTENIQVNVRIISTTNRNLAVAVQEGLFRSDLYYRLSGIRLAVPSLRQRVEDLEDLVWHFVNTYAGEAGRRITGLDPAMMEIFAKYHWPGNVRQLRNVVLTSLVLGNGPTLSLADVSWLFDELQPLAQDRTVGTVEESTPNLAGMPLDQIERSAILQTLEQTDGNRTKAAKALGISDRTLRDKIKRYREEESLQPA